MTERGATRGVSPALPEEDNSRRFAHGTHVFRPFDTKAFLFCDGVGMSPGGSPAPLFVVVHSKVPFDFFEPACCYLLARPLQRGAAARATDAERRGGGASRCGRRPVRLRRADCRPRAGRAPSSAAAQCPRPPLVAAARRVPVSQHVPRACVQVGRPLGSALTQQLRVQTGRWGSAASSVQCIVRG